MREKGVRLIHIRSGNENGRERERERAERSETETPREIGKRERGVRKLFTLNTK